MKKAQAIRREKQSKTHHRIRRRSMRNLKQEAPMIRKKSGGVQMHLYATKEYILYRIGKSTRVRQRLVG